QNLAQIQTLLANLMAGIGTLDDGLNIGIHKRSFWHVERSRRRLRWCASAAVRNGLAFTAPALAKTAREWRFKGLAPGRRGQIGCAGPSVHSMSADAPSCGALV